MSLLQWWSFVDQFEQQISASINRSLAAWLIKWIPRDNVSLSVQSMCHHSPGHTTLHHTTPLFLCVPLPFVPTIPCFPSGATKLVISFLLSPFPSSLWLLTLYKTHRHPSPRSLGLQEATRSYRIISHTIKMHMHHTGKQDKHRHTYTSMDMHAHMCKVGHF